MLIMRGGAVTILVGLTALIAYAAGRHDAPPTGSTTSAVVSATTKPVAFVEAPQHTSEIKPQPSPSTSPQPAAKPSQPEPAPSKSEVRHRVEVGLTAAAIAAIIIKASRERYYATGHPCACPDDLMRNGRQCGARSAYSRPGGAAPLCSPADVTAEMIDTYKKTATH
ncbi:hypothetical protein ACVWYJ_006943 [Bradyrhizobium sp. USDA 4471]